MKGEDDNIFSNWPLILVTLVNYAIALVFGFLNDLVSPFFPEN